MLLVSSGDNTDPHGPMVWFRIKQVLLSRPPLLPIWAWIQTIIWESNILAALWSRSQQLWSSSFRNTACSLSIHISDCTVQLPEQQNVQRQPSIWLVIGGIASTGSLWYYYLHLLSWLPSSYKSHITARGIECFSYIEYWQASDEWGKKNCYIPLYTLPQKCGRVIVLFQCIFIFILWVSFPWAFHTMLCTEEFLTQWTTKHFTDNNWLKFDFASYLQ